MNKSELTLHYEEITSGALQDLDRAIILGTRTYGKGLVQVPLDLPYNANVKITTSQALDAHQREELRQAVWGAIILIPQKFPETTMIQIEDKADITKGPGGEPAHFCETRLYTRPAFELKKATDLSYLIDNLSTGIKKE